MSSLQGVWGNWSNRTFADLYKKQLSDQLPAATASEFGAIGANNAFDPRAAYQDFATGAINRGKGVLDQSLQRLAGSAAGAGRLDTGFYDLDKGDVVRNVWGDVNNTLSSAALQTAGMEQGQLQYNQNTAADRVSRSYDLLAGGWDQWRADRQRQDKLDADRKKNSGWFGKLLGKTAGTVASNAAFAFL